MNTIILIIIGILLSAFTLFVIIVVILLLSDLLRITHFQMWQRLKKPPFSKFFWKNVIGLFILICFFAFMVFGTLFQGLPMDSTLSDKIVSILIKHNICSDPIRDCRTQERVFGGETTRIIHPTLYRASELNQETISEIIAVCFDAYNEKGHKKTVELTVYKETADQQIRWFSGVEPMIHIIFKGDK